MSVGQIVGGIGGAVIGFLAGGPGGALYGAQIGMGVGGLIDPPKGPNILGPRLSDLTTQTSTYGAVIPRVYGTVPIVGNVFWLENNQLKETENTQKQGKGGGSAESTTYTYSATFAVGLCEGPIAGINRIWIGANLIYDAGATDMGAILASGEAAPSFKVYLGSDTQLPDPRMQSTLGVANTPAYRGLAYIVFYDLPLAKYQNSLMGAQVKVEVARIQITSGPTVISTSVVPGIDPIPNFFGASALNADQYGRMNVFLNQTDFNVRGVIDSFGVFPFGVISKERSFLTGVNTAEHMLGWSDIPCMVYADDSGFVIYVADRQGSILNSFNVPPGSGMGDSLASGYFQNAGRQFVLCWSDGSGNSVVYDVSSAVPIAVHSTNSSSTYGRIHNIFIGTGEYYAITSTFQFLCLDLNWNVIWVVDMSAEASSFAGFGHGGSASPITVRSFVDGEIFLKYTNSFWSVSKNGYDFLGTASGLPIGYNNLGGNAVVSGVWIQYNPLHHSVYYVNFGHTTSENELLSSIVLEEALKSNLLTAADLDVSSLIQEVRGYAISSIAAIRSGFDPLVGAWPFDIIQSGYKIVCKARGSASVATIPVSQLDARSVSGQPGVQITNSREMDTVLPYKVALKYFDIDREYNPNEQYAERLNTQSVNIATMDLAIVLNADEAAQKAEVLLYMYWLERSDVSFNLPPEYNYLEPSDVITLAASDAIYELRLTQVNYTSDGRLECQAKYNHAAVYTSTAVGGISDAKGQVLALTGPSQYELMDIPLLKDVFDTAGFPVAMSGYLPGWSGGILMRSDDVGQTWMQIQGFSKPPATLGYVTNSLSSHSGLMIDKAGILVGRFNQALSSVTELQMLNGENHFAYGLDGRWEIIAAQNCVLQADGSYVLTDLLRGRFGSEWATGLHTINDHLILLNTVSLQFIASNLNTIGMTRTYRGITNGKTIDSDSNRTMTYNGVNLKCLSPAYLNGNRHPTTRDWTLTWIRRTRKGGELRDLVDVPLSEVSEAYSIDIFTDGTYMTVRRTLASTAPTVAYSSANQLADFGSNQATLYLKVYQLSEITGRGYPLVTSISR